MSKIFFFIMLFALISASAFSNNFLSRCKENGIALEARINQYDSGRDNIILSRHAVNLTNENATTSFQNSTWNIKPLYTKEADNQYRVEVTFECLDGELAHSALSVDIVSQVWSIDNYVLFPGAVYNGNRYASVKTDYPPYPVEFRQMGPNKPILISDQPRLNINQGYSRIQLRSGCMSLPSVGYHSPEHQKGILIWFPQNTHLGDYGVDIEETSDRTKAYISLTAPVVRERYKYTGNNTSTQTTDKPVSFSKGDKLTIEFRVRLFESKNIQALYDQFSDVQESYLQAATLDPIMPLSEAYETVKNKYNRSNWIAEGYYATQTQNDMFQTAWIGGIITLLPLLQEGDELTVKRVYRNLEWYFERCHTESNYFPDRIVDGKAFPTLHYKPVGNLYPIVLARKNAETPYYLFQLFDELEKKHFEVPERWKKRTLAAVNAQYHTFLKYKELGQFIDTKSGEMIVGNSTSAGFFSASLCKAYQFTGDSSYIGKAREIGAYFYSNFITKGLTFGGPADALHSFDSESSYALLASLMELYKVTGDTLWLDRTEEIAKQFATWVVTYNFEFPEGTLYEELKMQTSGTVYANSQNTCATPGICTHSGVALLDLYRFTGNRYYLKLLALIAKALPQYMSSKERPIECLEEGWVSERVNMTDWLEPIGETMCQSNWSEASLMLTYAELPSVYFNYAENWLLSLDHIDAKIIESSEKIIKLELFNPTDYDAQAKIIAEDGTLSIDSFKDCRAIMNKVTVPARERVVYEFSR